MYVNRIYLKISLFALFCVAAESELSDLGLNTLELVEKYGYPVERHQNVLTEDGYLLELHRIPFGKENYIGKGNYNSSNVILDQKRPVLLIVHGLLSHSQDFVNNGKNSLGFLAANKGYDVWLPNVRGTKWSRKHVKYNPDVDEEFWDFCWHEIGIYDLPAIIDYVLKMTQQNQLYYIGHSQGTTSFFVMTSQRPEYNSKINLMVAYSPVVFMSKMRCEICHLLARNFEMVTAVLKAIGLGKETSRDKFPLNVVFDQCSNDKMMWDTCITFAFRLYGDDWEQSNKTRLPVYLSDTPAGAATKQTLHYLQEVSSGKFCMYDYGEKKNILKYGKSQPPEYNLKKISAPVVLIYALNDFVSAVEDVQEFVEKVSSIVEVYEVPHGKFNHLDYLWAIDAKGLLYDRTFEFFDKYGTLDKYQ